MQPARLFRLPRKGCLGVGFDADLVVLEQSNRVSDVMIGGRWFVRGGRPVVTGPEEMVGDLGEVIDWAEGGGRVRVHGEIWKATAAADLGPGRRVRVEKIDGLTLHVEPVAEGR